MDLPEPRTPAGREGLEAVLSDAGGALVGFDFDGTLAPIVPDPAAARAHPGVPGTLTRLAAYVGRVVVVTGRPAALAVQLGGLDAVPGLVVLGHYGAERWTAGQLSAPPPPPGVDVVRRALPNVLADLPTGAVIEDKGSSLAVHTRRAPDPGGLFEALRAPLAQLAEDNGLVVEPGRLVLELRPPGVDKGAALRALIEENQPSCVVFAGDDLGDLAAFDAVDEARSRGLSGVLVCSGSDEVVELARRADVVVDGPAGLVALLDAVLDKLNALDDRDGRRPH